MRFSRSLAAGVAAVALVAASAMIPVGAATASVSSVTASVSSTANTPSRISAWFAGSALSVIRDTAAGATSLGAGKVDFATATSVGAPHRVDTWTKAFLTRGKRYALPTSHSSLWIAAIRASSTVIGTIVATDSAAGVSFVSYDDQADLGAGLQRLAAGSSVVHDPELSSWVAVKSGRVRALTAMTAVDLPGSKSLATYRAILIKRHASALGNSKGKVGASGGGGPVIPVSTETSFDAVTGFGAPALLALGVVGVGLYWRQRRRSVVT